MIPVDEQSRYRLGIAVGIGLLTGIERERRKGRSSARIEAGLRTFAVVALPGAVTVLLGGELLLAVAICGVAVLAAIGYHRGRKEDPGMTTVIALLLTLLLGALAMHEPPLAAALGAGVAILLAALSRLQAAGCIILRVVC